MKEFILHEIDEEIFERTDIKSLMLPLFRAGLFSFLFVIATYFLIEYWGKQMPNIIWSAPVVIPSIFLFTFFIESKFKRKLVFTDKYLKETNGSGGKKVKWKSVKSWTINNDMSRPRWPITYDVRRAKWLILEFKLSFNRTIYFRLHEKHGIENIKNLINKYGKI